MLDRASRPLRDPLDWDARTGRPTPSPAVDPAPAARRRRWWSTRPAAAAAEPHATRHRHRAGRRVAARATSGGSHHARAHRDGGRFNGGSTPYGLAGFAPPTFAGAPTADADRLRAPAFEQRPTGVRSQRHRAVQHAVVGHAARTSGSSSTIPTPPERRRREVTPPVNFGPPRGRRGGGLVRRRPPPERRDERRDAARAAPETRAAFAVTGLDRPHAVAATRSPADGSRRRGGPVPGLLTASRGRGTPGRALGTGGRVPDRAGGAACPLTCPTRCRGTPSCPGPDAASPPASTSPTRWPTPAETGRPGRARQLTVARPASGRAVPAVTACSSDVDWSGRVTSRRSRPKRCCGPCPRRTASPGRRVTWRSARLTTRTCRGGYTPARRRPSTGSGRGSRCCVALLRVHRRLPARARRPSSS